MMIQDVFLSYGLTGAIILGLGMYILKIEDRHRKERREMWEQQQREAEANREVQQKQFDRMIESSDRNTNILSGLKTLLENRNRP